MKRALKVIFGATMVVLAFLAVCQLNVGVVGTAHAVCIAPSPCPSTDPVRCEPSHNVYGNICLAMAACEDTAMCHPWNP